MTRLFRGDVLKHGSLVFLAVLLLNVANYVFYALAGHVLPVASYGEFMSVVALTIVATAPALVAQNTLSKLVADVVAAGDAGPVAGIARTTQRTAFIAGSLLFVAAWLLREPLAHLVHASDTVVVPLGAGAAFAAIIVPLQRGVFQGAHRFGDLSASMIVEALTRIAFVVPMTRMWGVRGALSALLLSLLVPAAASAVRTRMLWRVVAPRSLDVRRGWSAALGTGGGFLALMVMLYFDVIVVRHYFTPHVAGLYSAVSLVGRAIYTAVAFVPMIVIPKLVARRAAGASMSAILMLSAAVPVGVAVCAIGIAALMPAAVIAAVGGPAFRPAAPYLLPYAFAASALAAANVAVAVRVGLHRFTHVALLAIIASGEVVSVVVRHARIEQVLQTIVIGHCLGLVATLSAFALDRRRAAHKDIAGRPLTVSVRIE